MISLKFAAPSPPSSFTLPCSRCWRHDFLFKSKSERRKNTQFCSGISKWFCYFISCLRLLLFAFEKFHRNKFVLATAHSLSSRFVSLRVSFIVQHSVQTVAVRLFEMPQNDLNCIWVVSQNGIIKRTVIWKSRLQRETHCIWNDVRRRRFHIRSSSQTHTQKCVRRV